AVDDWRLPLTVHHTVFDGWSLGIFIRELTDSYAALTRGDRARHAPPAIQYGDYAAWQPPQAAAGVWASGLEFWARHLAGATGTAPHLDPPSATAATAA